MDEFVNWDHADPASGAGAGVEMLSPSLLPPGDPLADLDLALANVDGDDFSFWALQHFENHVSPTMDHSDEIPMPTDRSTRRFEDHLELFDVPCVNCQLGGYQCKRMPEGEYTGYCTSCVALRTSCSYGVAPAFPSNPWPVMGDHPEPIIHEDINVESHQCSSAPELAGLASVSGECTNANSAAKAKVGARFSRESVKILKNWLSTHSKHPYPNDEEKEILQKQTGLNKTQITNWLANTRRRNKNAVSHRSTSPGVRSFANPIDIPQRRGAAIEHMNPLQRWQHSPPENEPASVTAIARAVNASRSSVSSGLNSPYSLNFTDDGSGRSLCNSTVSSVNTSHSSTSVYSFGSRGSWGSQGSLPRGRRRRRRKPLTVAKAPTGPPKTYQCTFCTDTYKTKHDWQRHEKSLHLSLERWVCSPNGAKAFNPENGRISCVFCGHPDPDEAHIDSHNYSACQERTPGERSFYRKDHLRQHLKLVHNAKMVSWSMEQWKATTPEIRSRCGFCDAILDTWSIRVDHLAEHFKKGKTMEDWKGGWGFEAPVLDVVENSIPPYLIHDERNSPNPYKASQTPSTSARHAFELIKTELMFYSDDWRENEGRAPTDEELQRASCALVYAAEKASETTVDSTASWLRDLLFSSGRLAEEAKWTRIRGIDHRDKLRINGKGNIFESDPLEKELHEYVKARRLLGLTAMDSELQAQACKIIRQMEEKSNDPCEDVTQFLIRLINGSTQWLAGFRQRAHLPRSEDLADEGKRSKDPTTIDSTIHNPSRLEFELAEYVRGQKSLGINPTDADLQKKARMIIYEYDDGWNQTAADDPLWLAAFKERHVSPSSYNTGAPSNNFPLPIADMAGCCTGVWPNAQQSISPGDAMPSLTSGDSASGSHSGVRSVSSTRTTGRYYMSDTNCYQRLARELKKWVASTTSPNNPNCHIPSDEEIQHQARWIVYEDDDPWNQTAADNAEWLRRFKRDVGLLTDPTLPGLPRGAPWTIEQGGSGFAPPYVFPNPAKTMTALTTSPDQMEASPSFLPTPAADNNNDNNNTTNTTATGICAARLPANVFCSRGLEKELANFVTGEVLLRGGRGQGDGFPGDEAIRERARVFMGSVSTPADDAVLLGKFKEMMRGRLGLSASGGEGDRGLLLDGQEGMTAGQLGGGLSFAGVAASASDMNIDLSGGMSGELGDVLQHMDFDFSDLGDFMGGMDGMAMDQL